jgi:hypothetical protein
LFETRNFSKNKRVKNVKREEIINGLIGLKKLKETSFFIARTTKGEVKEIKRWVIGKPK